MGRATGQNPETFNDYDGFVEKFKPKKTTDDCYTPPEVYEIVKSYAVNTFDLGNREIVRPFYPGGDYENYDYPEDCVVIDNPPFSMLANICRFYVSRGIDFFLFAPALMAISTTKNIQGVSVICTGVAVEYENGAKVSTSFVTNMAAYLIATDPDLFEALDAVNEAKKANMPRYEYPQEFTYAAELNQLSKYGARFALYDFESLCVLRLDAQKPLKKKIYGSGYLISLDAAKRLNEARAEAERNKQKPKHKKPATVFELSDREREIINTLGGQK